MAAIKVPVTATNIDQAALVALLGNIATAVNALITDHNTLRTKLNADAGVTDAIGLHVIDVGIGGQKSG